MLGAAQTHRKRLDTLDLAKAGFKAENWLCVVGVNETTRVRLKIDKQGQSASFEFDSSDRDNKWSVPGATEADKRITGDGTVPFAGAIPKFLPYESLVCVRPDDFGYWEIQDRLTLRVGGFHGIMPNMDMLHRLIARFFKDASDPHDNTWGLPPPGVTAKQWKPPLNLDPPKN